MTKEETARILRSIAEAAHREANEIELTDDFDEEYIRLTFKYIIEKSQEYLDSSND